MLPSTRVVAKAYLTAGVVTCAFPIVAGVRNATNPPVALGIADVAVAAIFVVLGFILVWRTRSLPTDGDRVRALGMPGTVLGIVPVLLALFLILGERVDWQVLVVGLAWRGWFYIATLPNLATALYSQPAK